MTSRNGQLTAVVLCLVIFSCSHDNSTSTRANPYRGDWSIAFTGGFVGYASMVIDDNGQFFNEIALDGNSGSLTITGTVTVNGAVEAQILKDLSHIGSMNASLTHSGGSGTWQTNDGKAGTCRIYPIYY